MDYWEDNFLLRSLANLESCLKSIIYRCDRLKEKPMTLEIRWSDKYENYVN